jgi:hypothetical protein
MLRAATSAVTDTKPEALAKGIREDLAKRVAALRPKSVRSTPDNICANPTPKIAPFCYQQTLSHQEADLTYEGSAETAATTLRAALGANRLALANYNFAVSQAELTLQQAVAAAIAAYNAAINDDSHSREWYLFFTMELAIVTAAQAYEASVAAAADTLAGAAGALILAQQTYADSISAAQSQWLVSYATADQTFWQSVEGALDYTP